MKKTLEKYQKAIEKLNVFERQQLKSLIGSKTSNGMSRFYMVFEHHASANQTLDSINN